MVLSQIVQLLRSVDASDEIIHRSSLLYLAIIDGVRSGIARLLVQLLDFGFERLDFLILGLDGLLVACGELGFLIGSCFERCFYLTQLLLVRLELPILEFDGCLRHEQNGSEKWEFLHGYYG